MKYFWSFLLFAFCSTAMNAQFADPSDYIKFEAKSIDLGKIKKGDVISMEFTFENVSKEPIEIDFISTCECTEADWTYGEIAPGEKGIITAIFDSNKKDEVEEIELSIQLINTDPNTDIPIMDYVHYRYTY